MRHIPRSVTLRIAFAVSALMCAADSVIAQAYPVKPVRVIFPFPAGGPTDLLGRAVAQKLSDQTGQQFIADTRPGAGGNLGLELAAKAPPDGYTIVLSSPLVAISPSLYAKLNYDPAKDLAPISQIAIIQNGLLVHPSVPAKSLKEFLAWLKALPKPPTAGTAGAGSGSHIAGLYFENITGIKLQYVPYRGTAPAMNDLVAGQIDLIVDQTSNSISQVRAGTIRAYAITADKRIESASDIPTVDEAGLPGFHMTLWSGLWVPKDTPKEIVARLNAAAVDALNDPAVRKQLENLGLQMPPKDQLTPAALGDWQKAEITKWWPMIKAANVKVD